MSDAKTTNQELELATLGSNHQATTVPAATCVYKELASSYRPALTNFISSNDCSLKEATQRTLVRGKPLIHEKSHIGGVTFGEKPSHYKELKGGTLEVQDFVGVKSKTSPNNYASIVRGSPNLKLEGKPAVRTDDPTKQSAMNSDGLMLGTGFQLTEDELLNLLAHQCAIDNIEMECDHRHADLTPGDGPNGEQKSEKKDGEKGGAGKGAKADAKPAAQAKPEDKPAAGTAPKSNVVRFEVFIGDKVKIKTTRVNALNPGDPVVCLLETGKVKKNPAEECHTEYWLSRGDHKKTFFRPAFTALSQPHLYHDEVEVGELWLGKASEEEEKEEKEEKSEKKDPKKAKEKAELPETPEKSQADKDKAAHDSLAASNKAAYEGANDPNDTPEAHKARVVKAGQDAHAALNPPEAPAKGKAAPEAEAKQPQSLQTTIKAAQGLFTECSTLADLAIFMSSPQVEIKVAAMACSEPRTVIIAAFPRTGFKISFSELEKFKDLYEKLKSIRTLIDQISAFLTEFLQAGEPTFNVKTKVAGSVNLSFMEGADFTVKGRYKELKRDATGAGEKAAWKKPEVHLSWGVDGKIDSLIALKCKASVSLLGKGGPIGRFLHVAEMVCLSDNHQLDGKVEIDFDISVGVSAGAATRDEYGKFDYATKFVTTPKSKLDLSIRIQVSILAQVVIGVRSQWTPTVTLEPDPDKLLKVTFEGGPQIKAYITTNSDALGFVTNGYLKDSAFDFVIYDGGKTKTEMYPLDTGTIR